MRRQRARGIGVGDDGKFPRPDVSSSVAYQICPLPTRTGSVALAMLHGVPKEISNVTVGIKSAL